jgi:LysM repeat protein
MHRVESGETVAAIGRRFGVAPTSIIAANNLHSPEASLGDQLLIPTTLRAEPAAKHPVSHTAARRTTVVRTTHRTAVVKPVRKRPVIVAKVQ